MLLAGWGLDFALGGGLDHAPAWVVGIAVVVGYDALAIRATRAVRSLTVTRDEIRIGSHVLERADIAGLSVTPGETAVVFSRGPGQGLPKGTKPVALDLLSGLTVFVPTRFPTRLAQALAIKPAPPTVRMADAEDLAELPEVERRSDTVFTVIGIGPLPPPRTDYGAAAAVLVAGSPPYGFARVDLVDGQAHLEQLSVLPGRMRQGAGSALVEAACAWALEQGHDELSLVTFRDIAWNGPFYRRLGFAEVPDPPSALRALRDVDLGVPGVRVVMARRLGGSAG